AKKFGTKRLSTQITSIFQNLSHNFPESFLLSRQVSFCKVTSDILKADVIRKTLEIVLRYTADDM
ncbi:biofilm development regulator YmgB/AriR family protein, partial [Escherichia coli]|uniref:biofilm development regulator YmgB/AriR family protein n=1 Tax=Escherichia coli TaxID=562 RepID=UPI003EC0B916